MSKKRKTKKEKIISQERNQHLITQSSEQGVYSFTTSQIKVSESTPTHSNVSSYAYVGRDMKRTITITSILLLASIVLFILAQTRLINVSQFGY